MHLSGKPGPWDSRKDTGGEFAAFGCGEFAIFVAGEFARFASRGIAAKGRGGSKS